MEEIINITICIVIANILTILIINYIMSRLYFLKPMKQKYNIELITEKESKLHSIIISLILIFIISLLVSIYVALYFTNKQVFYIMILICVILIIYDFKKYKKYDILEYINYYSADLFDWDKIYELNIDENLKRNCFAIHNINYDTYKDRYMRHKEIMK